MTIRLIDFADGFQSSTDPTIGTIPANALKQFASDAAFVADKGSPAADGDIYKNTATDLIRFYSVAAAGFIDVVDAFHDQTVSGNKTFDGTTTWIDSTNLEVTDKNILVNKDGNDASAEGGGICVERTGTDGCIKYEDALASKFKAGPDGAEIELANVSSTQTLTNKTIDGNNNTLTVLAASQLSGATPIANGGTGQTTKAPAYDALSPNTTKGDLEVRGTTNTERLAVGTNNQVLRANDATSLGMQWSDPDVFWTKYTIGHAALQTASLTNDIELFSLAALGTIHKVVIKHTTAFAGTGITAYSVSVGIVGALDKYAIDFDVLQATGNTVFDVNESFGMENFAAATSIRIAATAVGANLDQSSAGSVDVYVLGSKLPS